MGKIFDINEKTLFVALILVFAMLFTMFPVSAFSVTRTDDSSANQNTQTDASLEHSDLAFEADNSMGNMISNAMQEKQDEQVAENENHIIELTVEDNVADDTTIKFADNAIVVILNTEDPFEIVYSQPVPDVNPEDNIEWLETRSGERYYIMAKINIPSIDCYYPILNTTTDELLKIAPTKFHGADPNEVGNFCIVGHNYRSDKFFSHVPDLPLGEIIEITDKNVVTKLFFF